MQINNLYINLLENDLNPFILFDSSGKMQDFNKEAEFLFNFVQPKELYELAINYASLSFGFNKKFISLKYGKLAFYAILVGYENDDAIAIRLYKEVCSEDEIVMTKNIEFANIFSLIEVSKTTTLLQNDITIEETYDISIPQMKIDINQFMLTLNECFELFKKENHLKLKVYLKTGEYELIQNKKHQIASIEFISEKNVIINKALTTNALKSNINIFVDGVALKLDFPMIL